MAGSQVRDWTDLSCGTLRNNSLTESPLSFHSSRTSTPPPSPPDPAEEKDAAAFGVVVVVDVASALSEPAAPAASATVLYLGALSTSGCLTSTLVTIQSPLPFFNSFAAIQPFFTTCLTNRSSFLNEDFLRSTVA